MSIRIACDFWCIFMGLVTLGIIIAGQTDHRFCSRDQLSRIDAFVEMIGHPVHGTMVSPVQPFLKSHGLFIQSFGTGDAHQEESGFLGKGLDDGRVLIANRLSVRDDKL